jgi:hypothetical protein
MNKNTLKKETCSVKGSFIRTDQDVASRGLVGKTATSSLKKINKK